MNLGEKSFLSKDSVARISESPGVYIFWDKENLPLYVGKSLNLRKRVMTYLSDKLSPKTRRMISEANSFSIIKVVSDLEALLLEAKLVKVLQPRFNSQLKDDKHPLYIRITKEVYPRVLTARRIEETSPNIAFFGPFPSSTNVNHVLKMLRRIFPYAQHKPGKRGCLYSQIGLCNPCPSEIENVKSEGLKNKLNKRYLKNIKNIKNILSGNIAKVIAQLEKEMRILASRELYEEARNYRDQVIRLHYITQPINPISEFLKNPNFLEDIYNEERNELKKILSSYLKIGNRISRIECFDVAHLAGTHPTASMVTFIDGVPEKSLYRHFKIKQAKKMDDISSLKEVAKRRSLHWADWGVPDLILVDGGKAQVAIFWGELKTKNIPVIGLAKKFETLVVPHLVRSKLVFREFRVPRGPALNLLQKIRDEAHRFARRLHHRLIQKELLQ